MGKRIGTPHTDETKWHLRKLALARPPMTIETRQKISEQLTGKEKSLEHKIRIGLSNEGKVRTPEQRKAISEGRQKQLARLRQSEIDRQTND